MQVVSLGCLVLYASYEFHQILTQPPPVKPSVVRWDTLGKWRLCPGTPYLHIPGGQPLTVGFGLRVYEDPDYDTDSFLSSITVSKNESCLEIDCTHAASPPPPPLIFSVCYDASGATTTHTWAHQKWNRLQFQNPQMLTTMKFSKTRYVQDSGFGTDWHDAISAIRDDQFVDGGSDHMWWCKRKPEGRSSGALAGVINIWIEEPTFHVVTEQGALPQVLALLAKLGGFVSLLMTIFSLIWVKRFPNSEVVNTYEARTLVGHAAAEDLPQQPLSSSASTMQGAPQSNTLGLIQSERTERQEFPRFPPGIAVPSGHRPTE